MQPADEEKYQDKLGDIHCDPERDRLLCKWFHHTGNHYRSDVQHRRHRGALQHVVEIKETNYHCSSNNEDRLDG